MENRKTSSYSPRAPNLLHVLPSRMVGWNELCNPGGSTALLYAANTVNMVNTVDMVYTVDIVTLLTELKFVTTVATGSRVKFLPTM